MGDLCQDRVDTVDMARFRACRSLYLPHSLMVYSGKMSEDSKMSEYNAKQDTVERHAQRRAMSTASALSRLGSPTKKIHHGFLLILFYVYDDIVI